MLPAKRVKEFARWDRRLAHRRTGMLLNNLKFQSLARHRVQNSKIRPESILSRTKDLGIRESIFGSVETVNYEPGFDSKLTGADFYSFWPCSGSTASETWP